jgi:hypothetical protein
MALSPSVHPSAGVYRRNNGVEIAWWYITAGVFDCNKPIERGARCIKAAEWSGGGRKKKSE